MPNSFDEEHNCRHGDHPFFIIHSEFTWWENLQHNNNAKHQKCKTQLQNKSMKWHKKSFENLIIEWKSAKHEVFKYILVKAHTWMTMAKSIISCTSTWITLMIKTTNNGVMNVEEQNKQQWHEER
jgi:hypothetical protein